MFIFFLFFATFYGLYYYLSYQVILLNDLEQIFSQTATKAQQDLKQYSDLLLEDLGKCYQNVLILILCATVISFLWILLLKYNAKIIIWFSLFSLPIILSVGLYYSTTTYINLHNKQASSTNEIASFSSPSSTANGNIDETFSTSPIDLQQVPQNHDYDKALQNILTAEFISYIHNETLWLVISIVLFIILMILFIILHSLRERVRLSIALIRQASKAVNGVKSTLLFPIIPRAIGIGALIYGILISLLIISASHRTYQYNSGPMKGQTCNPRAFKTLTNSGAAIPQRRFNDVTNLNNKINSTVRFDGPTNIRNNRMDIPPSLATNSIALNGQNESNKRLECIAVQPLSRQHVWKYHAINIFATLWFIHFISGISQTTLAGAFASYYWAYRKPQDVPFFAVTASFCRVLRNHLGDIAFGSFLIATIRYIRIVIEFIDNRIRKKSSPDINNSTARSMTCFFRVFFWILDRFLKYIDRNAYIMMSMYGEGYLQSAKRAVTLLYKNSTRAIVLDYVTYFVLLVSRLLITIGVGFVTAQEMFTSGLNYKWLPIALVVSGTYFISKGLFSVYSMAVDTLFICFLIDSTQNDGSTERPYFMPKDLRKIMKRNTVIS